MKTAANKDVAPLVIRGARASVGARPLHDVADTSDDPMPNAVKRISVGVILHRDTLTTEVHQETTDDN